MRIAISSLAFLLMSTQSLPAYAQTFGAVGTRAEGMGGAFVAVADDSTAAYWNPAGLATGSTFDFQVSVANDARVFVGAAMPALGLSYFRTQQDTASATGSPSESRQMDGSGQLRVRPLTTHNVGVSVLQTLAPGLVVGTTMRVVTGGVEGVDSDTTFDVDAGAMMSAWHIRFGFVGRNLREPEFQGELGTVLMKRHFRIGAALVPRAASTGVHGPFSLDVDADLTTQETPLGDRRGAAVGGEYWLAAGRVGVRAGFRWSTLGDFDRAVSVGLSVKLPKSIYAEGQLTKPRDSDENQWTVGGRVTF